MNNLDLMTMFNTSMNKAIKDVQEINAIRASIKHPHFKYAVYDPEKKSVVYRWKKPWKWFSGKREVRVKIAKFEMEGLASYESKKSY